MKPILLDLRGKIDPQIVRLLRGASQVAGEQDIEFFVTGAAARDLVLEHGFGLRSTRATTDVDLALAVEDWRVYERFFGTMMEVGLVTRVRNIPHKYALTRSSLAVDGVPFGGVESPDGTIAWPPDFATRMSVIGYKDALRCAWWGDIEADLRVRIASVEGLTFLKVLAWADRHNETQRDGVDLGLIFANYGNSIVRQRLMQEAFALWESEDFDWRVAGARLLGRDMVQVMSARTRRAVLGTIAHELTDASGLKLVLAIAGRASSDANFDQALTLVQKV